MDLLSLSLCATLDTMSPKSTKPTTKKHAVPIVNVFDEDQSTAAVQPARRPVVVEIEDVESEMPTPTPPTFAEPEPHPAPPLSAPEPTAQRVWPSQTQPQMTQPEMQPQMQSQAFVQPQMSMPEVSNVAPVNPLFDPAPQAQPQPKVEVPMSNFVQPQVMPQNVGMSAEPTLPSFFEHDLKSGMNAGMAPMQTQPQVSQPVGAANPNMFSDAAAVAPQAVVGEINEAADGDSGSNKKLIGIILMVLAVLILAIGGLFLYARNLFSPTSVATPIPEVVATPRPTPVPTATPAASASATLSASESAALKKKVKVDVLNGTKISGFATKQAALLKTAGFTTGTVGNGKAEEAGTIVYPAAYKGLVTEIKATLKDLTFTASESAKATSIVVTLGQ